MIYAKQSIRQHVSLRATDAFYFGDYMKKLDYFTTFEKLLWLFSNLFIIISFVIFDGEGYLTLFASLIGVTALIFQAKANPVGPTLMIVFSLIYGYISMGYAYYGETITYVGMSLPMAVLSLVSWLKNPYKGNKAEVTVNRIKPKEPIFIVFLSLIVTVAFYFILRAFGTANLIPSTLSVTTSYSAAYLTFRRSPYYALLYTANDIVLILLWSFATLDDISYVSVLVCFVVFLVNDLYSFFNWKRLEKRQSDLP